MAETYKPKTRRVVIHRKVTAAEYEKHKDRMESLGMDPTEPAPSGMDDEMETERPTMFPEASPVNKPAASSGVGFAASSPRESSMGGKNVKKARVVGTGSQVKKVSLQKRTLEEQIMADRNERALDRWDKQQQEWETFRRVASQKTGRDKADLVVTRAEEFRERLEVMELLDRATPDEIKSGGSSWYHSLRGEGTRFVQIGNMFSGLFLPIKLHKENYVHEIVRKPLLKELHDKRNGEMETGPERSLKTWRDDDVLITRLRRHAKKMRDLAPGKLGFDEVMGPDAFGVRGTAIQGQSQDQAQTDGGMFSDDEEQSAGCAVALQSALAPVGEEEPAPVLLIGPHMEALPSSLQFRADVQKICTQSITLKNTGTAVANYEWKQNIPRHGFDESLLPDDPTSRFVCEQAKGRILPGREVITLFTFTSSTPGTFMTSWRLTNYPELLEPITNVTMHGVAGEGDLLQERRSAFCKHVHDEQVLHQVQEIIEDIVVSVTLDPPKPFDLSSDQVQECLFSRRNASQSLFWTPHSWQRLSKLGDQISSFQAAAPGPRVNSKGANPKNLAAGAGRADDTRPVRGRRPVKKPDPGPPPRPPEEMAPCPLEMISLLDKVTTVPRLGLAEATPEETILYWDKQRLSVEVARAVREAKVQQPERSPIWWAAHETVLELVMSVPRFAAHSRKFAMLDASPFITPPAEDASPEAVAAFDEKMDARRTQRGLEENQEKETKAQESFSKTFSKCRFGPAMTKFSEMAREASVVADIQAGAVKLPSLRERIQPYVGRQNIETVELAGGVVVYEADLGFLASLVNVDCATPEELRAALPDGALEQVKQRLAGLASVLETNPLAVLVVAHVGTPVPDAMQPPKEGTADDGSARATPEPGAEGGSGDAELDFLAKVRAKDAEHLRGVMARMASLLSMETLLDDVREAAPGASMVEFVSHETWLGEEKAIETFAKKVRNEARENKVFLLENLSAIPEELGIHRLSQVPPKVEKVEEEVVDPKAKGKDKKKAAAEVEEEPAAPVEDPDPKIHRLTWATRENWAKRVMAYLQPDFLVQDSFAATCQNYTLHTGIWPNAPLKVVGPSIELEMGNLIEVLPYLVPGGEAAAGDGAGDVEEGAGPTSPAPLLCAIGGGGYGKQGGEELLIKKLKLLIGIAQLTKLEKDGVVIALGGELAVGVLSQIFGLKLGSPSFKPSLTLVAAMRETLLEVLARQCVPILLPVDFVCEELGAADAPPAEPPASGGADEVAKPRPSFKLTRCFAALATSPVSIGFVDETEIFLVVELERGLMRVRAGSREEAIAQAETFAAAEDAALAASGDGGGDPPAEPAVPESTDPMAPVPDGWQVRDIGDSTVDGLCATLRRCRGMLWNGAFGIWEDERWQHGTRALLAFVEQRLNGGDEEEEDDEDEEDEDEEEEEGAPPKPVKIKKEPDADFELALVIGHDSAQVIPSLVETPASISFISQSGDALLQVLRGDPLPGLLVCPEGTPQN